MATVLRKRTIWVVTAAVIAVFIVGGFIAPRTIPRLGLFPAPLASDWNDGCNSHSRAWYHSGPFWGSSEVSTEIACVHRP